ncbi:MAG: hypothetical protein ABFS56_18635 [Pseudomonadota bacterium]
MSLEINFKANSSSRLKPTENVTGLALSVVSGMERSGFPETTIRRGNPLWLP